MYKVRILLSGDYGEIIRLYSSYSEALSSFLFYIRCTCEFSLSVRCINIIKGRKTIKLFQNL